MTDEIRNRIAKIYALVKDGATSGERAAAQTALDRLMKKYNLSDENISSIHLKDYAFTYTSYLEEQLMIAIMKHFLEDYEDAFSKARKRIFDPVHLKRCKQIVLKLNYLDYVTIDSAYEYFRRHMKEQWNKSCRPLIAKCRKPKTRQNKLKELQEPFLVRYLYLSKLIGDDEIKKVPVTSKADADRNAAVRGVKGGQYHTQVQTAHMIEQGSKQVKADIHGQINLFS